MLVNEWRRAEKAYLRAKKFLGFVIPELRNEMSGIYVSTLSTATQRDSLSKKQMRDSSERDAKGLKPDCAFLISYLLIKYPATLTCFFSSSNPESRHSHLPLSIQRLDPIFQ